MHDRTLVLAPDESKLLERAAAWPHSTSATDLTREDVQCIARIEGIDFATALVYQHMRHSHQHGPRIREIESLNLSLADYAGRSAGTVALVPGAFYRDRFQNSGADGKLVIAEAQRLGFTTTVAPTLSFGDLETNARIIADWLAQPYPGPIILISLSKGTADVKFALRDGRSRSAFNNVNAWLSLSGIWFGSPLVGWLLTRPLRSFLVRLLLAARGHSFRVVKQLGYDAEGLLSGDVEVPEHLDVLHVIGFPLVQHLCTSVSRRVHRRLTPLGPNDAGGILLGDIWRLPGTVYPVWGADHYLQPVGIDNRLLVRRLLVWLGHRCGCKTFPVAGIQG
jgi:hypothetical protein